MAERLHHVVIIGGGFGGLYAAQALKHAPLQVTLVDRRNFHLFQPLLYQVATGGLSPGEIASPLRGVLRRQRNTAVLLAEVTDIDPSTRRVVFSDGEISYDTLIVAAGATHHYFGNPQWAPLAPGLKTIEDATEIRRRVFLAFEAAERETDPERRAAWLTFAIVGAGPTGVELAGALSEIANHTLARDFRTIDPSDARIIVIEGADRVLPPYPPALSAKAAAALKRIHVQLRTGATVTAIAPDAVTLRAGDCSESIPTRTVLWAAGVQASVLARTLAEKTAVPLDRAGRVVVAPDCSVPGHPEIFVIGDLAHFSHQTAAPLPGVAPVAMQQGRYVARLLQRRLAGQTMAAFRYVDRGSMAVIGRRAAVAKIAGLQFNGTLAWLAWLFVHLMYLVEFDNRLLVLMQWAWNYFTWNRGARLITGESPLPLKR
ncbi:MAG TPA: NAD(P)/FAD-dependent oxidoreductase [Candidatus Kryptonia bacterium]|nr:NAD(P)/FAD-dependent oxidoreductase [Candidatus Kryptonia bacterium]